MRRDCPTRSPKRLTPIVQTAIVLLCEELGATLVDQGGSTDSGVMGLAGRAYPRAHATFPLVGVVALGTIAGPEAVVRDPAELEPNHTHVLLVPGGAWGDESPWLVRVTACAHTRGTGRGRAPRRGAISVHDVDNLVSANAPVFVVPGSGRLADALSGSSNSDDPRVTALRQSQLVVPVRAIDDPSLLEIALAARSPERGSRSRLTEVSVADQRHAPRGVHRPLEHEFHNLQRWPTLCWQQLHNRLQWEGGTVKSIVADEAARREVPGASTWIRLRTRFDESAALMRTLEHAGSVEVCAVSPDGSWIASASYEAVTIWEVATGVERATLNDDSYRFLDCTVAPDGSWFVTAGSEATIREPTSAGALTVWDSATGVKRATLYSGAVSSCAVAPDGSWILSVGEQTLRIWDAATGVERAHVTDQSYPVAVSPDGSWIASVSNGFVLKILGRDNARGASSARWPRVGDLGVCRLTRWILVGVCQW